MQHECRLDRLMVLIPHGLSDLVAKGEITPRYYNPGNLFREVHIVTTTGDDPDARRVLDMVGDASLTIHRFPTGRGLFIRTLGWRRQLLRSWAAAIVDLAARIRPQLVRCHGAHLNGFAAAEIKRRLGIPFVVSLHINPDEDQRKRASGWEERLRLAALRSVEKDCLRTADLVMPVYQPIVPYLERIGVRAYKVMYNVLHPAALRPKNDYTLHEPVRILSVGRQFAEKNPDNLIRAVARFGNVHLTLVGDGSHHDHLRKVAYEECGLADRVTFRRAVPNDELCSMLADFDIFATHSEYWEISKSVLEPLLCGLPVIINRRKGAPVPELTDDICTLVENSVEGYQAALQNLIEDDGRRERLGRAAFARARDTWDPAVTERKFVGVYRHAVERTG